jgi:hypothetical protein
MNDSGLAASPSIVRSEPNPPLKILYISGPGRTASTLLGNVLNEVPGFFYVGELMDVWRIIHNRWESQCGCGELLLECPIWTPVLKAQLPPGHTLTSFSPLVMKWLSTSFRARHTWSLLNRAESDLQSSPSIRGYLDLMESTYRTLQRTTGARVIVDSSKAPAPAAGLTRVQGLKTFVVHLVRDPRAVAHAWRQRKAGLEQYGIVHSAAEWVRLTTASDAVVRSLNGAAMLLRYEDFVAEPARSVAAVLNMMGEDASANPVHGRKVTLSSNHSVFGNPDRFQRGEVEIRPDVRWETAMPRLQSLAVTMLTYMFMRRYGYV